MRKLYAGCALALAVPALIAGCGGGSDEEAEDLLREALGQDVSYDSGVVNIGLDGSLEGETSGTIDATVSGPFQSSGEGKPIELQLDAEAAVDAQGIPQLPGGSISFDLAGGLALVDNKLFVSYQDTTYEAGKDLYRTIRPFLEGATQASETTQDPESADTFINALTDLENEGTEDLDGESVTRVSGNFDLESLAEEAGGDEALPFDPAQLEGFDATADVLVAEDDTVRGMELGFAADAGDFEVLESTGVDGFDFTISFGVSEPNEEQTIEAPDDTEPLDDLLGQFGLSEDEIVEQLEGGLPLPGAGALPGQPGADPSGQEAIDPDVQECVQQAEDSDEIAECLNQ